MKRSLKKVKERRQSIISLLEEVPNQSLTVESLADTLDVSCMTIRRDLTVLDDMGIIERSHGYATLIDQPHFEGDTENLRLERLKQAIAQKAAAYVKPNMTLFMNTSSTALNVVDYLSDVSLTIFTNNLRMSQKKVNPSSTIILSGGEIRFPKEALVGELANESLSHINADIAIIGCSAISAEKGITTGDYYESKINRHMIKNARQLVIVVADYRKIGNHSNFLVSNLDNINILITDIHADLTALRKIEQSGVTVIQVAL